MSVYLYAQPDFYDKDHLNSADFERILTDIVKEKRSGKYLCVTNDGIEIVGRIQKCFQKIKGWLGFGNNANTKLVDYEILKVTYQIEIQRSTFNSQELKRIQTLIDEIATKKVSEAIKPFFIDLAAAKNDINRDDIRKKLQNSLILYHRKFISNLKPPLWKRVCCFCWSRIAVPRAFQFGDTYLALARKEFKKPSIAFEYCEKAIKLDNANSDFIRNLCAAVDSLFTSNFVELTKINRLFVALGDRAARSESYKLAYEKYEKAVKHGHQLDHSSLVSKAYEFIGDQQVADKHYSEAISSYKRARLKSSHQLVIALNGVIEEEINKNNLDGYEKAYSFLIELIPLLQDPQAINDASLKKANVNAELALRYIRSSNYKESKQYLAKINVHEVINKQLLENIVKEINKLIEQRNDDDTHFAIFFEGLPQHDEFVDISVHRAKYIAICLKKAATENAKKRSAVMALLKTPPLTAEATKWYEKALFAATAKELVTGKDWIQQLLDCYLNTQDQKKIGQLFAQLKKRDVIDKIPLEIKNFKIDQASEFYKQKNYVVLEIVADIWFRQSRYADVVTLYENAKIQGECCNRWYLKSLIALGDIHFNRHGNPSSAVIATAKRLTKVAVFALSFTFPKQAEPDIHLALKHYQKAWIQWKLICKTDPKLAYELLLESLWAFNFIQHSESRQKEKDTAEMLDEVLNIIMNSKENHALNINSEVKIKLAHRLWIRAKNHPAKLSQVISLYISALKILAQDIPSWYQEFIKNFMESLEKHLQTFPDDKLQVLEWIEEAIKYNPGTAQLYFKKAELLEQIGKSELEEILSNYNRAVHHAYENPFFDENPYTFVSIKEYNPKMTHDSFVEPGNVRCELMDDVSRDNVPKASDNFAERLKFLIDTAHNLAISWKGAPSSAQKRPISD